MLNNSQVVKLIANGCVNAQSFTKVAEGDYVVTVLKDRKYRVYAQDANGKYAGNELQDDKKTNAKIIAFCDFLDNKTGVNVNLGCPIEVANLKTGTILLVHVNAKGFANFGNLQAIDAKTAAKLISKEVPA
jgi:hypothetical protein